MMLLLLVLLVVLAFGGGGWGYSRYGLAGGIGPIGLLAVVLLSLYVTGNLHLGR